MKSEFLTNLDTLKRGTEQKKIKWEALNDDIFYWPTIDEQKQKVNVIIQKIKAGNITFRVYNPSAQKVLMEVNSEKLDAETSHALNDLFDYIKSNALAIKTEILSSLLKNI